MALSLIRLNMSYFMNFDVFMCIVPVPDSTIKHFNTVL
jgi:hypothetical protein